MQLVQYMDNILFHLNKWRQKQKDREKERARVYLRRDGGTRYWETGAKQEIFFDRNDYPL